MPSLVVWTSGHINRVSPCLQMRPLCTWLRPWRLTSPEHSHCLSEVGQFFSWFQDQTAHLYWMVSLWSEPESLSSSQLIATSASKRECQELYQYLRVYSCWSLEGVAVLFDHLLLDSVILASKCFEKARQLLRFAAQQATGPWKFGFSQTVPMARSWWLEHSFQLALAGNVSTGKPRLSCSSRTAWNRGKAGYAASWEAYRCGGKDSSFWYNSGSVYTAISTASLIY